MKHVIIINGTGACGKDTLCQAAARRYRARTVSSVDPIKEMARVAGWRGEKDARARAFLSALKRLTIDYNDFPKTAMLRAAEAFMASEEELLFIHIREPEEIEKLRRALLSRSIPCTTLLITRQGAREDWGNPSDDAVAHYSYAHTYRNDGPLETIETDFCGFLSSLDL